MSEASRMISIARSSSPGPSTISTIDSRSQTQPRLGAISPAGASSTTPPQPGTASPVSAHRHLQELLEKGPQLDTDTKTTPQPEQGPATEIYPKILSRPAAPHIASALKPPTQKKPKRQPSSKATRGLEKLAKTDIGTTIEPQPERAPPVDLTSEIVPYPERILMSTPCLRLDIPPEEDSDASASPPVEGRREKAVLAERTPQTKSGSEKLPTKDFAHEPIPQKRLTPEKLPTKGPTAETIPQKKKSRWEKLPTKDLAAEATSQHEESFRSSPKLTVNTPLEKFSATNTDREKALPAEPPATGTGPPGPSDGYLSSRMSRPREIAFIFLVCMLQIIPQACLTICFPTSSIIAHALRITDPAVLPWMIAAYATTFGTFILVSGRLGDIFGHKKLVIVGFIMMTPWSVIAGVSPKITPILFFVARAVQGVAASLMVPNGLALLGRTYAPGSKMKTVAFSLFGLCAPLGAYLGMLLAAIFAEYVIWIVTFFVLAGVSFSCAIASIFVLVSPPPTPDQMKPFKEKLGDMDWLGAFTGVAGLICVQVAFVSAPGVGWGTSWIYMLLIIGALLIAAFVVVEIKIAEHPLVPFKLLRSDVAFVLAAVACGWAVFGIWSWYLWRYFLSIRHYTPLESAIHFLPIVPVALLASILTAYLMHTTKPAWILLYATFAATLGPLFLYFAPPTQTYWGCTFVSLLVMPIFMDFCLPAATYIMSNFFPMHMQGISGSLVATVLNYSISLGLGLATTAEVYTGVGDTTGLTGIHSAWLTGVGIGGLGVLICVVYLFKSVLSHQAPAWPPTIRDLKVASMMQFDSEDDRPQERHNDLPKPVTAAKPPQSLRNRSSFAASLGLARGSSNATGRPSRFSMGASMGRGRRNSNTSQESSLFPLTRKSSASTERPQRDTLTTALPDWRDRMMPQFEWRQVEVPGTGPSVATRYQQAQRIHVSQQARYYQGRRA